MSTDKFDPCLSACDWLLTINDRCCVLLLLGTRWINMVHVWCNTHTPCRLCSYSLNMHEHVGQVHGLKCCKQCKAHSSDTTSSMACRRICWIQQHRCRHLCSDARHPSPSRAQTLQPSLANTLQLKPKLPQLQVSLCSKPPTSLKIPGLALPVAVANDQLRVLNTTGLIDLWLWHADIHN